MKRFTFGYRTGNLGASNQRQSRRQPVRWLGLLLATIALTAAFVPTIASAGNDFVDTELRVDLPVIFQARDYIAYVAPTAKPASTGAYTNGWLGLNLASYTGATYSAQFSQVGLMTYNTGVQWFVYAEPGVQCLRGTNAWVGTDGVVRGCVGSFSDLVSVGQWTKVELVTYGQGFWIARVYDQNSVGHDVAKIWSTSLRIYRAFQVSEEGYWVSSDPYLTMSYYHWHPQYMAGGQGFQDWPASGSTGSTNYLFTSPSTICPGHYGAYLRLSGDPRYWFDGNVTGAYACSTNPQF
jgi:hypothetical protein